MNEWCCRNIVRWVDCLEICYLLTYLRDKDYTVSTHERQFALEQ